MTECESVCVCVCVCVCVPQKMLGLLRFAVDLVLRKLCILLLCVC